MAAVETPFAGLAAADDLTPTAVPFCMLLGGSDAATVFFACDDVSFVTVPALSLASAWAMATGNVVNVGPASAELAATLPVTDGGAVAADKCSVGAAGAIAAAEGEATRAGTTDATDPAWIVPTLRVPARPDPAKPPDAIPGQRRKFGDGGTFMGGKLAVTLPSPMRGEALRSILSNSRSVLA